jgi:hypothetical protein
MFTTDPVLHTQKVPNTQKMLQTQKIQWVYRALCDYLQQISEQDYSTTPLQSAITVDSVLAHPEWSHEQQTQRLYEQLYAWREQSRTVNSRWVRHVVQMFLPAIEACRTEAEVRKVIASLFAQVLGSPVAPVPQKAAPPYVAATPLPIPVKRGRGRPRKNHSQCSSRGIFKGGSRCISRFGTRFGTITTPPTPTLCPECSRWKRSHTFP